MPRVVGSERWNIGRGEDYLLRDRRGEDCHPAQEAFALAAMDAAKSGGTLEQIGKRKGITLDNRSASGADGWRVEFFDRSAQGGKLQVAARNSGLELLTMVGITQDSLDSDP